MTNGTASSSGGLPDPVVRRRLRKRPPAAVRSAIGTLSTLTAFFTVVIVMLLLVAVVGLRGAGDAAGVLVPLLAPAAIVAGATVWVIRTRQPWAWAVALIVSLVAVLGPGFLVVQLAGGAGDLDGNAGFAVGAGLAIVALLGLAATLNLIAGRSWFTGERIPPLRASETGARPISAPLIGEAEPGAAAPAIEAAAPVPPTTAAVASTTVPPTGGASTDGSQPLLSVRDLKKHFPIVGGVLRRQIGTVYAVDGVSFDVLPGETFSLVGESGCGKTTLGRTILQLTEPTAGRVIFDGYELEDVEPDDMRPLRRRMQIIFQDPFGSLNPRMPVSDIIGEGLLSQGLTDRKARDKKVEDSLEIVGLRREYTRRYPHEFSGGQRQRIGVARALALGPDLIVADEPVSALDVSIQSQVLNLLLDLKRELNLTYLFISHNLSVIQYFSDRVGVMYLGKIVELGTVEELYADPKHPYTVALLSAIPEPDPRRRRKRLVLKGDVPSPAAPPSGCRFHTRCWLREKLGNPERCSAEEPPLLPLPGLEDISTGGRLVACHYADRVSERTVEEAAAESPAVVAAEA